MPRFVPALALAGVLHQGNGEICPCDTALVVRVLMSSPAIYCRQASPPVGLCACVRLSKLLRRTPL